MSKPSAPKHVAVLGWISAVIVLAVVAIVAAGHPALGAHSSVAVSMLPSQAPHTTHTTVTPAMQDHIRAQFSALPLAFEANEGQTDPQVKYLARGNGYTIFLTATDAVFSVHSSASRESSTSSHGLSSHLPTKHVEQESASIRMELAGANSQAQMIAGNQAPGVINYYRGSDPSNWHEGVKQYSAVTYRDVYPGVNLAFHGAQRQLEFDFIVAPSANAASIQLGFTGASKLATDDAGNLVLTSSAGDMLLHRPVAYQEKDGQRERVDARFVLEAKNKIGFELGDYDHSRQLIIDPSVTYATYLGGTGDDEAYAIAVDTAGDVYVTGTTTSPTFGGATNAGSEADVFVSEVKPTGTSLVYTTILTGSGGNSSGDAIVVDGTGNAYIAGGAAASFPVTAGAYQTTYGGNLDAFVAKLASSTGSLTFSTYLGGSEQDVAEGIAIDGATPPNVYVAGGTLSSPFPGTSTSTIQSTFAGTPGSNENAFVTELNGAGTSIVYSTYLGGSVQNSASGIALDPNGNAYVAGITGSPDFPTTSGAFQTTPGGEDDAFVAEIAAGGSSLAYSTYLGGSGSDNALGIAVDSTGAAYVTGGTNSTNFPTVNAVQKAAGGSGATNVFVTKLAPGGTALVFSTYYGGGTSSTSQPSADAGTGIALDAFNDVYVTGRTTSSNYPVSNGFQSSLNGTSDAFVTEFANTGFVEYSSFLGGSGTENGVGGQDGNGPIGAIAVDSTSNTYLAGDTTSSDFPVTSGVYQPASGGGTDAFVARVNAAPADFSVAVSPTTVSVASGQTTSTVTVTVSSVNASFGQAVSLSCTALPADATCTFSNSSVTPTTSPVTSNLTINTAASSTALFPGLRRGGQVYAAIFLPIFGVTILGAGIGTRRKKPFWLMLLGLMLLALMLFPACGGGSNSGGGGGGGGGSTGTTPGSYPITISGTAGSTTHTASLNLTVTSN